jgi:glycine betaine/proline transport system substrate-binding protein
MFSLRYGRRAATVTAIGAVVAVGLAGCSSSDSSSGTKNDKSKTINIALPPAGWTEGVAASMVWAQILKDQGYKVNTQTASLGVIFTGLGKGDFDLYLDTWLPKTHATYVKTEGDKITDLGTWYDNAKLTIAVNDDSPAQSIGDLKNDASDYGNQLVGIEAGAGETGVVKNDVIPGYGLQDMKFLVSSTPAMLAQLKSSLAKKQNVAVTLWRPHWAYSQYKIRDLKDPKNLMGNAEHIHSYGNADFAKSHPQIDGWLKNFKMTDKQLGTLENMMENTPKYKNDTAGAVSAWMKANPDFEKSMVASS